MSTGRLVTVVVLSLTAPLVALGQPAEAPKPPAAPGPAVLQPPAGEPPGPLPPPTGFRGPRAPFMHDWEDKDLKELIDTVRLYRLSRVLELTDEQTVLLMRRYDDLKKKTAELSEQRGKALDALREKVQNQAPESEIEEVLKRIVTIERESFNAKVDTLQKAGEGLSPTQRAKLLLFMQDFERDMRRLLERAREWRDDPQDPAREQFKRRIREWAPGSAGGEGPAEGGPVGRPAGPKTLPPERQGAFPGMRWQRPAQEPVSPNPEPK